MTFAVASLQQDLAAYWIAGKTRWFGLDPYLSYGGSAIAPRLWDGVAPYRHSRFLYPPLAAELFRLLAILPYRFAKVAFTGAAVAGWLLTARLVARRPGGRPQDVSVVVAAGALWVPLFFHLERGQIDLLLLPLVFWAWSRRARAAAGAGAALALAATFKPALLGLLPVLVALGRWRWAATTLAFSGVAVAAGVVISGPALTREYATVVLPRAALYGEGGNEEMLNNRPLPSTDEAGETTELEGISYKIALRPFDGAASASLPRWLAPTTPHWTTSVLPYLFVIAGLGWAARRRRPRPRQPGFRRRRASAVHRRDPGLRRDLADRLGDELRLGAADRAAGLDRRRAGTGAASARRVPGRRVDRVHAVAARQRLGRHRGDGPRGRRRRRGRRADGEPMIWLAASVAMLVVLARGLDRRLETPGESRAAKVTRMLLFAVAAVVVVEAWLGAVGLLDQRWTLIGLAAPALLVALLARRHPRLQPELREPLSHGDVGLGAALVAAIALRAWAGLHKTTFLYDTLSYHLHVPATWMHDGRIGIVPAVFGDPSPAYAPGNLELVFLFLMAPLRSDYLAGIGQVVFAVLAATAIVATVREAGGRRAAALGAALAFLLIPEVWGQVPTAMTDLGLAACLLASLPFALRLWRARMPSRADLLVFAAAIGLGVGSKYAGAALALPFVAVGAIALVHRGRRVRARDGLLALAVALATGGFWYVRNTVLTGNPFYPVALPGLPLPALYGGAEMRAWEYHLPVADLGALGAMLIAAGVGFAGAAAIALVRLWRRLETLLLVALLATFWLAIPYQESRFLFAAFGVAAIALARAVDRPPALVGWCGLGVALVGALLQAPTPERLLLVPVGAAAAIAHALRRRLSFHPGRLARRLLALAAASALLFALAVGYGNYVRSAPAYTLGDDDQAAAWAWLRANVSDGRVAYAGTNLAFPLAGRRPMNRVAYVNVAGAPGDRLHDFGPPGDGTAEPAPYRRGANPEVWLAEPARRAHRVPVRRRAVSDRAADDRRRPRRLSRRARLGGRAPRILPPALRLGRRAHLFRGAAMNRGRAAGAACAAALLLFVAGRCLVPMDETDLFFNLRLGEIVLHDHAVPRTNLLSFTYPDARDVNLAWLFQIVLALAHRAGGIPGTLLLKTAFVLATIAVLYRVARRRGAHPAAAALALALSAWAAEPRFVERPHLVTFLGLALTLLALERAESGRPRALYALVPCGLVWANANSCFFLAPLCLALYALGARFDGRRADARRAALCALALGPLILATPSGVHALGYIANHWRMPWLRPLQEYDPAAWPDHAPAAFVAVGVLVAAAWPGRRWRALLPVILLGIAGRDAGAFSPSSRCWRRRSSRAR